MNRQQSPRAKVSGLPVSSLGPEVSVIVPAYQAVSTIEACLNSLFGQSLAPGRFEVLLVFNGPDDGARVKAQGLATLNQHHQLRILESDRVSAGAARNLGLDQAHGSHITFIDVDDWVSSNYLEELLAAADGVHVPAAGVVDVDDGVVDANTTVMRKFPKGRRQFAEFDSMRLLSSMTVGKLWPGPWLAAHRFDPGLRSGEDVAFNGTLLAQFSHRFSSYSVAPYRNGALYYRRLTPGSISRTEHDFDFAVTQRLAVIRALTAGDQYLSGGRMPLISSLVTSQTRFINAYLGSHPGEGVRVLTAVACADVPNLPVSTDLTGRAYRTVYRKRPAAVRARFVVAAGEASTLNRLSPQLALLRERGVALRLAFVKGNLSKRIAEIPNHRISIVAVPDASPRRAKNLSARLRAGALTLGRQAGRLNRKATSRLLSSPAIVRIARFGNPKAADFLSYGPVIAADNRMAPWSRLSATEANPLSAIHSLVLEQAAACPTVTEPQSSAIGSSASWLGERPRDDDDVPPASTWALASWRLHRAGHRDDLAKVVSSALRHFPDCSDSDGFRLLGMLSDPAAVRFDDAVETMTAAALAASAALETGDLDRAVFLVTLICELLGCYELSLGSATPLLLENPEQLLASLRRAPAWRLLETPSREADYVPQRRITPSAVRARFLQGLRGQSQGSGPQGRAVVQFAEGDDLAVWPLLTDWSQVAEVVYPASHIRRSVERLLGTRIAHVTARIAPPELPTGALAGPPATNASRTLGLVGWASIAKDPLWALEVLAILRANDPSWRLKLIGEDFPGGAAHPLDDHYAAAFRARAVDLAGGIEYVGRTNKLPQHLSEVGFALNSSLREAVPSGFEQMVAAGAMPVIRNWPVYRGVDGAASAFPQAWVVDTPQDAANRILAHSFRPEEG